MANNRKRHIGLGGFLNKASKDASLNENKNIILRVDIDNIKSNPGNFYGLRDIDKLAEQINLSKFVEPLIIVDNTDKSTDGKDYLLIAGHRRKAAWEKLLEEKKVTDRTLPCNLVHFEPIRIKREDGTEKVIPVDKIADMYLMLSNMGQREIRTIDERLEEISRLEPLAKEIYDALPRGERGNFRTYFAEEFLKISESKLQRLQSMKKLSPLAKTYVDEGKVSFIFGATLSTFTPEEQEKYLAEIDNGERNNYIQDLVDYKKSLKEANKEEDTSTPADTDENVITPEEDEETTTDALPVEPQEDNEDMEPMDEELEDSASSSIMEPEGAINEDNQDSVSHDAGENEIIEPWKPAVPTDEEIDELDSSAVRVEIEDLPEDLSSPTFKAKEEAINWVVKSQIESLEKIKVYAKAQGERYEEVDELKCGQWMLRYGETLSQLAILREKIKN